MFREITIKNFRAIAELTIKFTPFTMLVGENSCGKSSVLQALDLLCSIVSRDIDEYLKDREWDFDDIRSQFCQKNAPIAFVAKMDIAGTEVIWNITINYADKWIIKESLCDVNTQESYLPAPQEQLDLKSSLIKILPAMQAYGNSSITQEQAAFVMEVKDTLQSCESFELLSPDRMRSGSRGKVNSIGMGGERLAAYIHTMNDMTKNELNRTVSEFVGFPVEITTTTKGQPGWVEMYVEEQWQDKSVKIKKHYTSDGLLRIIALCAILIRPIEEQRMLFALSDSSSSSSPRGFVLLDEIEDGINPNLAEKLIQGFQRVASETKRQFILTTHSPVMVNYVEQDNIVFMWRDAHGIIKAQPLFETERMKETLEFLNPGEAWFHYSKQDIIERLSSTQDGSDD